MCACISRSETDQKPGFSFPDRGRDPFAGTNNVLAFERPPVTIESVAAALKAMVAVAGPLPPDPLDEPEKRLVVPTPGNGELTGWDIYWTDAQGRLRRGAELV